MKLRTAHRREKGAALFVAVLMLALMGALGIAAMTSVSHDREAAGYYNRDRTSFYAAEAAAAAARSRFEHVEDPEDEVHKANFRPGVVIGAFPTEASPATLGDASLYDREPQTPRYYGDPDQNPPIEYTGVSYQSMHGDNIGVNAKSKRYNTLWRIRVVGEGPTGERSRVEVIQVKKLSSEY